MYLAKVIHSKMAKLRLRSLSVTSEPAAITNMLLSFASYEMAISFPTVYVKEMEI